MAVSDARAGGFHYAEALAALWRECRVPDWFHVEAWDGVLAKGDDDVAGVQLLAQHGRRRQVAGESILGGQLLRAG